MNDKLFLWLYFALLVSISGSMTVVLMGATIKGLCKKETKKLHYEPYSNGKYFKLSIDHKKLKGHKLECSGEFEGELPKFNDILHIYVGAKDIGVSVRRSYSDGNRAYLKLYIPEKVDVDFINTVTSFRKNYKKKSDELNLEVTYPLTIKRSLGEILLTFFVMAMGAIILCLTAVDGFQLFPIALGLFFIFIGIFLLLFNLSSSLTLIDEKHLIIKQNFKTKELTVDDIDVSILQGQNEHFQFTIYDKATHKQLCVYSDNCKRFNEALSSLIKNYQDVEDETV